MRWREEIRKKPEEKERKNEKRKRQNKKKREKNFCLDPIFFSYSFQSTSTADQPKWWWNSWYLEERERGRKIRRKRENGKGWDEKWLKILPHPHVFLVHHSFLFLFYFSFSWKKKKREKKKDREETSCVNKVTKDGKNLLKNHNFTIFWNHDFQLKINFFLSSFSSFSLFFLYGKNSRWIQRFITMICMKFCSPSLSLILSLFLSFSLIFFFLSFFLFHPKVILFDLDHLSIL